MSKLIADYEAGTLTIETKADPDAPSFAQDTPTVYTGELNAENMLEANEYMEKKQAKLMEDQSQEDPQE